MRQSWNWTSLSQSATFGMTQSNYGLTQSINVAPRTVSTDRRNFFYNINHCDQVKFERKMMDNSY